MLFAPDPAHCQDGTKFIIRSHVVDSGGGVVRSENYRGVHFSLGQPLLGGESADAGKTLSAGFVNTVKMAKEGQSTPGDCVYGSGGGSSCFIGTLSGISIRTNPEDAGNGG